MAGRQGRGISGAGNAVTEGGVNSSRRKNVTGGIRATPVVKHATDAMESALPMLQALRYESRFCNASKPPRPLLTRFAFTSSKERSLTYFATLVSWLISIASNGKIGNSSFKAHDDPTESVNALLTQISELGMPLIQCSTSCLTVGYGDEVATLIEAVASSALSVESNARNSPSLQPESIECSGENEGIDTSGDGEEMIDETDDDDDDAAAAEASHDDKFNQLDEVLEAGDQVAPIHLKDGSGAAHDADPSICEFAAADAVGVSGVEDAHDPSKQLLESNISSKAWKAEVERVTPKLKVKVAADSKDWRGHLEKAKEHMHTVEQNVPEAQRHLEGIASEASKELEKIFSREKILNSQLEQQLQHFSQRSSTLKELEKQHSSSRDNASGLKAELEEVASRLDEVKASLSERGDSLSDTSPLMKVQKAKAQLQQDIAALDVKLGVARNSLLNIHNAKPGQGDDDDEEFEDEIDVYEDSDEEHSEEELSNDADSDKDEGSANEEVTFERRIAASGSDHYNDGHDIGMED